MDAQINKLRAQQLVLFRDREVEAESDGLTLKSGEQLGL
jgi:hypothetical protein